MAIRDKNEKQPKRASGMGGIVKTSVRLTMGMLLVYGAHVVFQSKTSPGSGFVGGGIIALSFLYLLLAYGRDFTFQKLNRERAMLFTKSGILAMLIIGVLRFLGVSGFRHFLISVNIFISLLVGAGLFVIFVGLVLITRRGKITMVYFLCLVLFAVGAYGFFVKRNAIKLILSLLICSYSTHLFLVLSGYKNRGVAPLIEPGVKTGTLVDPVPQVLVMLSIIVSLAVTALLVTACLRLYKEFGTFELEEIEKKRRNSMKDKKEEARR